MKLSKDHLIEGKIIEKGTEIEIIQEASVMSQGEQANWLRQINNLTKMDAGNNTVMVYIGFDDNSDITYKIDTNKLKVIEFHLSNIFKGSKAEKFNMYINGMDFTWILSHAKEDR